MANDARVRQLLKAVGVSIPVTTWFVGAQRNTCNNDVTFYDDDLVPARCAAVFEAARGARTLPAVRRRAALVSAAGCAGACRRTRRRPGAAAARVRPRHQCVL